MLETLPEWITFLVSIILAPAIVQALKFYADKWGKEIHRFWITIFIAVLSLVLAAVVIRPEIPVYEDPIEFLSQIWEIGAAILGMSTLIYNLFLSKVFDKVQFVPSWRIKEITSKHADH